MRVVLAPDSFGGTLDAVDAAHALAAGWLAERRDDELVLRPMGDGGEGTLDAVSAARGGTRMAVEVLDALGAVRTAQLLRLDDGAVLVESAQACGLAQLGDRALDQQRASTVGVAALLRAAMSAGAPHVLVGCGGSATVDGGLGALVGLGAVALDSAGTPVVGGLAELRRVASLDLGPVRAALTEVPITVLADVDVPLCGDSGAARLFGPQKGLAAGDVAAADDALARWARHLDATGALADLPGGGAGGGLAAALVACGARLVPGGAAVADLVGLSAAIAGASVVVTGEGSLDGQTTRGKAPAVVARAAGEVGVPCVAVAGRVSLGRRELAAWGFTEALSLTELAAGELGARAEPARWLHAAGAALAQRWGRDEPAVRH